MLRKFVSQSAGIATHFAKEVAKDQLGKIAMEGVQGKTDTAMKYFNAGKGIMQMAGLAAPTHDSTAFKFNTSQLPTLTSQFRFT